MSLVRSSAMDGGSAYRIHLIERNVLTHLTRKVSRIAARIGCTWAPAVWFAAAAFAQNPPQEFTVCPNGCQPIVLSGGSQLIAEGGATANRASLIAVDPAGDQLALPFLGGLPSGRAADGAPFGPVAYALDGRNLYIALGEADGFHSGGPSLINRAAPTALAGSVWQVTLSADPTVSGPFVLRPADGQQVLAGQTVTVWDFSGNSATIQQIANLGPGAQPSAVATLAGIPNRVYVVDSGTKRLLAIDGGTGEAVPVAQFPVKPESLRVYDDHQLLLTLFGAQPGTSSVWLLDPIAGASHLLAGNLDSAVDAIARGGTLFVLQNSTGPQGLGRLITVNAGGAIGSVLADGLNDPTTLAIDDFTGRLFFFSRGDGVIYDLPLAVR